MDSWTGTFELVNPLVIVVDHRYQRELKPVLVSSIAASPAWEAFSVITCFKRDNGMLYAVDGQQRLAGLLESEKIPARVPVVWFPVATVEEEARIFSVINEARKALHPMEKHHARLTAKEEASLAIERAVDKAGFSIAWGGTYGPRTIGAIGQLQRAYNEVGEDGIVQILCLVRDAWPDDRLAVSSQILYLLTTLVSENNGTFNRTSLTIKLAKTSPSKIVRKAEELTFDLGGSKRANMRRALKALAKV